MGKVDHPDVNFADTSRRAAVDRPFWWLLPIIDDEERAGVEPVGTLAPNDREEGTELALDGLQELHPEAGSVMQELMEGLSEALDREFSSIVLVFAEKVLLINLINLIIKKERKREELPTQEKACHCCGCRVTS